MKNRVNCLCCYCRDDKGGTAGVLVKYSGAIPVYMAMAMFSLRDTVQHMNLQR